MIKESRQALINYLYSSKGLKWLICNDIYQELLDFISIDKCICDENVDDEARAKNLNFVKGAIKGFILGAKQSKTELFKQYGQDKIDTMVDDIVIGLLLHISSTIDEFAKIDILEDKKSICFGEIFVLDLVS